MVTHSWPGIISTHTQVLPWASSVAFSISLSQFPHCSVQMARAFIATIMRLKPKLGIKPGEKLELAPFFVIARNLVM